MKTIQRHGHILLLALGAWFGFCVSARAWNAEGHMVVAQIAYSHLTPAAKARCDALIAVTVFGSGANNNTFPTAACWADDIKGMTSAYNTWHYIDLPFSLDGTSTNSFVVPSPHVVSQINQCIAALQNTSTSVSNQAMNLRFLLHFVGDIQQPLHCSTAISASHPGGDAGGNSFSLSGSPNNLHSLWDQGAGYLTDPLPRPLSSDSLSILGYKVADVETTYPYSLGFCSIPDPMDWAVEGRNLAQTVSYVGITQGGSPSSGYLATGQSTSRQRMAAGGQRLADVLNIIFDPQTNAPAILSQPASETVPVGNTASFSVGVCGATPLSYLWRRSGSPITGATQASYSTNNVQLADSGSQFNCVVSNSLGSVTSSIATLTVPMPPANDQCTGAVGITGTSYSTNESILTAGSTGDPLPSCGSNASNGVWFQYTAPANGQIEVDTFGSDFGFDTVLAIYTGSCGVLTQVGCNDNASIFTTTSQVTNPVVAGTTYYILVAGNNGQGGNLGFHLAAYVGPPVITSQPVSQTRLPGGTASFSVSAGGAAPLSYQWWRNSSPIAGATNELYATNNVQLADSGAQFSCLVSNFLGTAISTGAVLTVVPPTAPGVSLSTLVSLNDTNGHYPFAGLVKGADGYLYGTTTGGGTNDSGTVFRMTTNGTLTTLISFSYYDTGGAPYGPLLQGADGNFYGTAQYGGTNAGGTIFRIATNGTLTTLASFDHYVNGAYPSAGLIQAADGNFYGTAQYGGAYDGGTIFRITTNGTLTTVFSFNFNNGAYPSSELIQGPDGYLYGTTSEGGASGYGTVFRATTNGGLTRLASFDVTNGASPYAGLMIGADGNFYGTTSWGGTNGSGTVFKMTPSGRLTTLYSFDYNNSGGNPYAALLQAMDGNLYGTTYNGGLGGGGTLFRIGPNGGLATLVHFNGLNGWGPQGRLLQAADGNFYGTTPYGGANGLGNVFQLNITASLQITTQPAGLLAYMGEDVAFNAAAVGTIPISFHWKTHGTNLTDHGNVSGSSTPGLRFTDVTPANAGIYQVVVSNLSGSLTSASALLQVLVSPPIITSQPASQTILEGWGAGFTVEAVGDLPLYYQWQHNGTNLTDGPNISGADSSELSIAVAGLADGGTYSVLVADDLGEVMSDDATLSVIPLSAPGTAFSALHSSDGFTQGYGNPLIEGRDGYLYGATYYGDTNGYGTVFKMTTNGALTTLVSFSYTNGSHPFGGVIQGADDKLYGATTYGGDSGYGTAFKITTSGTLATLVSFNSANGANPGRLVQTPDGNLYGTTGGGGVNFNGTVFTLSTNGALTTLFYFGYSNGANPVAGLILGTDGNLYGTTSGGGATGNGTVFRMTTNGVLTKLVSFNSTNGAAPQAGLVQARDGDFYGTTTYGGTNGGYGTVFRVTTNGVLTTLVSFNSFVSFSQANGAYPYGGLIQGIDGDFYGTTQSGGLGYGGTLFKMSPDGTLRTLVWFDGTNGSGPLATLLQASDGRLYGSTFSGGRGGGTIFRLTIPTFLKDRFTEPAATDGSPYSANSATNAVAPDGDPLTFAKVSGPAWLNVAGNGALSGTPTSPDVGTNTFGVSLADTHGWYSTATMTVFVNGVAASVAAGPANQTVSIGSDATFTVTAGGTTPRTYAWRRNGVAIPGATAGSYTVTNAQLSDSGSLFSCLVSNAFGWVLSSNALLKVNTTIANDQCAGAIIILAANYTHTQSTAYATSLADPIVSCVPGFGNGVWYQFTPSSSGLLVVDTFGSDFDTGLGIYTGSCGSLSELACNDDTGGITSQITTGVNPGTTYRFLAGGYAGHSGNLVFHLGFASVIPSFLAGGASHLTNGQFQFTLSGAPGSNYQILTSTNLQDWSNLVSITLTNNPLIFVDTNKGFSRRFYRARLLP